MGKRKIVPSVQRRIRRVYAPIGAVVCVGAIMVALVSAASGNWAHRDTYMGPLWIAGFLLMVAVLVDVVQSEIRRPRERS